MTKYSQYNGAIFQEFLEDEINSAGCIEIRKKKFVEHLQLDIIAFDVVMIHVLHSQALKAAGLAYIDELLDAIDLEHGGTVREIIAHLLRLVPGLSEETAIALAKVKYHDLDWDTPVT